MLALTVTIALAAYQLDIATDRNQTADTRRAAAERLVALDAKWIAPALLASVKNFDGGDLAVIWAVAERGKFAVLPKLESLLEDTPFLSSKASTTLTFAILKLQGDKKKK